MKTTALILLLSLFGATASAAPIQLADDMAHDANIALANKKPIVLFVTADHCPYCEQLRQEYFQFSTNDERFILREIELDEYHDIIDFNGKKINHQLLADRYDISLTPTVAFVGPQGEPLSDPIIGVLTMDFYNYYFEQALAQAMAAMKGETLAKQP